MSLPGAGNPSGENDISQDDQNEDDLVIPKPSEEDIKPEFPYMDNLILASSLIGMWPNTTKRPPFVYHLRVWLTIALSLSVSLSFAIQIGMEYPNFDTISVLVDFVTVFVSATFRYVYIYIRGDKYLFLVSLIHNNFIHYSIFPKENRTSIMKHYKYSKILSLVYTSTTFLWILQIITVPLGVYFWKKSKLPLDSNETVPYPLPINIYVPFDVSVQPGNLLFYAYEVMAFLLLAWIYMAVDCFWYTTILLTIGQFSLLKDSVNDITTILKKYEFESKEGLQLLNENQIRKLEEGLKYCIRHHQFLRKFTRLVDNIMNPNNLVDSLHAVISIGFILLDVTISVNIGDWNKVVYSCEYLATSLVHMFLFDWLGNELAVKEEELAETIYDMPWYICPNQKPVVQLMAIQAKRPNRLTGGRMYTLSLDFFTAMIKTVFSYFTFLLQLKDGK